MIELLSSSSFLVLNKRLSKTFGLNAAVLLSDLISKEKYFVEKGEIRDGYFFNTSKNIEKDTTLSRHQQKKAIDILKENGIIKTKIMGIPAKLYFKIERSNIYTFFNTSFENNSKQDVKEVKRNKNKVINNKIKNNILERKQKFFDELLLITKDIDISKEELSKFFNYWTEPNRSGTKMNFEIQKTWNTKMRLNRWLSNKKDWNKNTDSKTKFHQQISSWQEAKNLIK